MNSLVGQTDHSNHFFIKHLSEINLRFKGKRGAPGELQGGGGTSSLCWPNRHTAIHSQPENKVPNENGNTPDPVSNVVFYILHRCKLMLFCLPEPLLLFQNQKGFQFNSNNSSTRWKDTMVSRQKPLDQSTLLMSIHLVEGGIQQELLGNPIRTHLFSSLWHI